MPVLDAWEKGRFTMLVEDTLGSMEAHLTHKQGYARAKDQDLPSKGHLWSSLGCCKILWRAGKGGILYRDDIDKISGNTDQSVLESKHPNAWIPDFAWLPNHNTTPNLVPFSISCSDLAQPFQSYAKLLQSSCKAPAKFTNWLAYDWLHYFLQPSVPISIIVLP